MKLLPFPFLGSTALYGNMGFHLMVKFAFRPNREIRENIVKSVPFAMTLAQSDFYYSTLHLKSGDSFEAEVERMYSDKHSVKTHCQRKAMEVFHIELLQWLSQIDRLVPIEVVVNKPVPGEMVNTKKFRLVKITATQLENLFVKWAANKQGSVQENETQEFQELVHAISFYSSYLGESFSILTKKYLPDKYIQTLAHRGQLHQIRAVLESTTANDEYFHKVCDGLVQYLESNDNDDSVFKLISKLIVENTRFKNFVIKLNRANNHFLILTAIKKNDLRFLKNMQRLIGTVSAKHIEAIVLPIYWWTVKEPVRKKEWALAIKLYEFMLEILRSNNVVLSDKSFYCNCLWILQQDNTRLPVNIKLNNKFLNLALPRGKENPAVLLNAACLYVEMGDTQSAFDCIQQAILFGISGSEFRALIDDVKNHPLFQNLRELPAAKVFLSTLIPEP